MALTENWDTIPKLIKRNYEKWGSRTAMCMKKFGIWQRYSWREYYEMVKCLSLGLVRLGLKPGDMVCIIGDNEPEWFWSEFATQAAGGIATGIFVDSIPAEVNYIAAHSDAKFVIVNDQEQTDKLLEIKNELPALKKIVYWDPKGLKNYNDPILISFSEVIEMGEAYETANPGPFEQTMEKLKGDDAAFIYYTAGTTGLPKGAIFTHCALIITARQFISRYPLNENDDLISNFPAAWVGDSFFATIPHLLSGARLNFPEEPETITEDTRETGPSLVTYGPRQWEGLVSEIQAKMSHASSLKRSVYNRFLPVGYKMADYNFQGKKLSLSQRALHRIAHLILFRPLQDRLGMSKVRFAVTGGSVLSLDTFRLIHALGIDLRQNYASTEAGFISSHGKGETKSESVGRPVLGTEARITEQGELLVRSKGMFKGYHKDPSKTTETLVNGWCHTGDAVNIDEEGHLIFMDRLEHMGELSSGIKYAPQYIESRLRFSQYIKNAMVIGGKDKDFVSAILNIDFATVRKWAEQNRVAYATFADLSQRREVADLVQRDLIRVNSFLLEGTRIRKFVMLPKEFDPDEAELTRTRQLRRTLIEARYKELIDTIYSGGSEIEVKAPVTYRDGRKGIITTSIKVWTVADGLI